MSKDTYNYVKIIFKTNFTKTKYLTKTKNLHNQPTQPTYMHAALALRIMFGQATQLFKKKKKK